MARAGQGGFSLTQFEQGGLASEILGTITHAYWTIFDYEGKSASSATGLMLTIQEENEQGTPTGHVYDKQFWSAGSTSFSVPDDEDTVEAHGGPQTLRCVGNRSSLVDGCQLHLLLGSLEKCGLPKSNPFVSDADCRGLVHSKIHLVRKPAPKRDGLADQKEGKTILMATQWAPAGSGLKGGVAATPTVARHATTPATGQPVTPAASAAPATSADGEMDKELAVMLNDLHPPYNGVKVAITQWRQELMQKITAAGKPTPWRNSAMQRASNVDYLTGLGYIVEGAGAGMTITA